MHKKEYALAAVKVADYGTANKILSRLSGRKSIMANLNEFDTKDNLMAVGNGVVNLTTGELSPGKAADMHSLYTTINYNPEAQAPRWNQFLSEIFPDNPEIIAFLQRAVGMTLYGNETEVFFICYGVGANGKSVFLDVIKTILQKYADKAAISTFTGKNDDSSRARSDIVRLAGRRMIVTSENKAEVELDTGLIKEWSGDKEIVARGLYSAEVKFEPKGSIWFATNHKPIIKDDSDGTWRRCRMVPFMTTIPEERRNSKLGDELVANEAEGILAWMIAGAKEFASSGLQVPESIRAATEDYKEEQLPALQFAREMLEVAFVDTPWKDLTDAYKNWQYENDMPCSPRADAKALEKALRQISKTIQKKRITNGYVATNVQLKSM
jgi:putative DNA primase/helicase